MIKNYKMFETDNNEDIPIYRNIVPIIGIPSGEYIELTQDQFRILQELYLVKYDIRLKSMIFEDSDYKIIMANIDNKKEKIIKFLKSIGLERYNINKDYTVDALQNVKIDMILKSLPVQFDYVLGDFDISNCGLYSLKGCPEVISGDFICSNNILEDLEFGPEQVNGDYDARQCGIRSLKGSPKEIKGDFICGYNSLENLIGGPIKVRGSYFVDNCLLDTLEGAPKMILGDFICSFNFLENLREGPHTVNGTYDCSNNSIKTLNNGPILAGVFKCNGNKNLKDLSLVPKANKIISDEF